MLKILAGKRNQFFDVFQGDGWKNWSRYVLKDNKLTHLTGNKLTPVQLKEVGHAVNHP